MRTKSKREILRAARDAIAIAELEAERDRLREALKAIELQAKIMPHKWTFPDEVAAAARKALEGAGE